MAGFSKLEGERLGFDELFELFKCLEAAQLVKYERVSSAFRDVCVALQRQVKGLSVSDEVFTFTDRIRVRDPVAYLLSGPGPVEIQLHRIPLKKYLKTQKEERSSSRETYGSLLIRILEKFPAIRALEFGMVRIESLRVAQKIGQLYERPESRLRYLSVDMRWMTMDFLSEIILRVPLVHLKVDANFDLKSELFRVQEANSIQYFEYEGVRGEHFSRIMPR